MVSWMLLVFLLKYKLHPETSSFNFFFSYGMAVKKNKKRASCSPVSPGVVQLRKLVTGGEIPDMSVRFCTGGHFLGTKLRIRIVAPGYLAWS